MLDDSNLTKLLHQQDVTQMDKVLLIIYAFNKPISLLDIREKAISLGLYEISNWKLSTILGRAKLYVANTKEGWSLKARGVTYLQDKSYTETSPVSIKINDALRKELSKLESKIAKDFLDEAISCYECKFYRAAIVLSWAGAMHVLREFVVKNKLSEFNQAVQARFSKRITSQLNNTDDLGKLGDKDFLELLDDIGLIDKSIKVHLQSQADTRNGCAHPTKLQNRDNQVAAFLESLIIHIFQPFS